MAWQRQGTLDYDMRLLDWTARGVPAPLAGRRAEGWTYPGAWTSV